MILLSRQLWFPPVEYAREDGLLAVGGDLSPQRLLLAYRSGIFPWYNEQTPLLWWSPDPRLVLYPERFHRSRRLQRQIRQKMFTITFDAAFDRVIRCCATSARKNDAGTWIVADMMAAYRQLHRMGFAHSVESWVDGRIAGGLYGLALGGCFFGESMFTRIPNGSKVAMAALVDFLLANDFALIDCQVPSPHLHRLGAEEIPRKQFIRELKIGLQHRPDLTGNWGQISADSKP